jgi:phosphocarrier protein HPr
MREEKVLIINSAGLHTRPAATIVKIASKFKCEFFLNKDGLHINGKSIIGVMTLAAEKGSEITLTFDGDDEDQAAEEVIAYFKRGFDEM